MKIKKKKPNIVKFVEELKSSDDYEAVIEEYINITGDINYEDSNGDNLLRFVLARIGNPEVVSSLIKKGAEFIKDEDSYFDLLELAQCLNPDINVVEFLCELGGVSFNKRFIHYYYYLAARTNPNVEVIEALHKKRIELDDTGEYPIDPLILSMSTNPNPEIVKSICKSRGLEFDQELILDYLHYASSFNPYENVLIFLVDLIEEKKMKIREEENPLEQAMKNNPNPEIVMLLCEMAGIKVDEDFLINYFYGAMVFNQNEGVLDFLLEKGVDVKREIKNYPAIIKNAMTGNPNPEIVRRLCEINKQPFDDDFFQDYMVLASKFNPEISVFEFLFEKGADINLPDENGLTPFSKACFSNESEEVIFFMLEKGGNIKYENKGEEIDVLLLAMANNPNPAVVESLCEFSGKDFFDKSFIQDYFYEAASSNPFPEVIEFLIKRGADLYKVDKRDGKSALEKAETYNENPEIAKIIKKSF